MNIYQSIVLILIASSCVFGDELSLNLYSKGDDDQKQSSLDVVLEIINNSEKIITVSDSPISHSRSERLVDLHEGRGQNNLSSFDIDFILVVSYEVKIEDENPDGIQSMSGGKLVPLRALQIAPKTSLFIKIKLDKRTAAKKSLVRIEAAKGSSYFVSNKIEVHQ